MFKEFLESLQARLRAIAKIAYYSCIKKEVEDDVEADRPTVPTYACEPREYLQ